MASFAAVHISADSIPELRKACLLGALHGSGSLAPATSDGPERNGLPTTLTKAAQRSALSAGELSRPTQIDGFGASSVKQNDRDPWNASMGQALGKSTKLHKPEFGGSLGRAVSQMGTEVASSSAALSNLILTEAAMKAEVEHLFRRVQAQTLVNTEDHVDKRPGDHPLEGASSQGQNVPSLLFAGRSDGQADGRFRLCCGCNEAALYETGKTQYLQRLKQYQTARRRWNEAMLAVQSSMNGH